MATLIRYRPNLFDFPRQVYSDANFLISFYVTKNKWHKNASLLLTELTTKGVEIHVSLLAVDEALCQLLRSSYEDQKGQGSWDRDKPLKKDPSLAASLQPNLDSFVRKLRTLPSVRLVDFPPSTASLVDDLLANIAADSLAPRDALHLAVLRAEGLTMIVTNDTDFDRVSDPAIRVLHFW